MYLYVVNYFMNNIFNLAPVVIHKVNKLDRYQHGAYCDKNWNKINYQIIPSRKGSYDVSLRATSWGLGLSFHNMLETFCNHKYLDKHILVLNKKETGEKEINNFELQLKTSKISVIELK